MIEHMFDFVFGRVSNVCSVRCAVGAHGPCPGGSEMELVLKVVLVGYVLYAVLGAPMVATQRERIVR